ncbi:DUF5394 family protein [Rickettsiales endosymbiont of Stachyamoeba lipophora]|uniref:DUF5394 family protein n=1 Tax=Rickettsiales endosymbiont of Stachyamoeba lipophora TaxID=2486578 RepID=UPI000F648B0F|nr:DUF5394 family protein [Rickettsiales endosymbiont of Stachyamoeba lipophora]AZL15414.1 hypothetical protein EF513_02445 [Rickettsiales endosymbiont of Stachyamoeba lipophora]
MTHTNKYYEEIIKKFPNADKALLDKIIRRFNTNGTDQIYDLILEILESIFAELEAGGFGSSLSSLEESERIIVEQEIEKLLNTVGEEYGDLSKDEIIQLLLKTIHRKFTQKHALGKQPKEKGNIPKHVKEFIKQDLLRAFVYEFYKFVNPNQIAGETKMDNFINNVVYGGVKYAVKHAGKEYIQDKEAMSQVNQMVKNINKSNVGIGR